MLLFCNRSKTNCLLFYLIDFFFIAFPLVMGLLIYLICDPNAYVSRVLLNLLPQQPLFFSRNVVAVSRGLCFFRNYGCDCFWAFSMSYCVAVIMRGSERGSVISFCVSLALGVGLEALQRYGVFTGTFDWWDIIFETVAVLTACLIQSFIYRRTKK